MVQVRAPSAGGRSGWQPREDTEDALEQSDAAKHQSMWSVSKCSLKLGFRVALVLTMQFPGNLFQLWSWRKNGNSHAASFTEKVKLSPHPPANK